MSVIDPDGVELGSAMVMVEVLIAMDENHFARIGYGVGDLFAAALVLFGVFGALPTRYLPVDIGASVIVLLLAAAGVSLLTKRPFARLVVRVASSVVLAAGLLLIALLASAVAFLSGIYGPPGKGGALIFALVIALVFPYLVVFPALQLLAVGSPRVEVSSKPANT